MDPKTPLTSALENILTLLIPRYIPHLRYDRMFLCTDIARIFFTLSLPGQAASHLYTMILVDKLYYPLDPPVGDPAASPFVPRSDDPALANVLIT